MCAKFHYDRPTISAVIMAVSRPRCTQQASLLDVAAAARLQAPYFIKFAHTNDLDEILSVSPHRG